MGSKPSSVSEAGSQAFKEHASADAITGIQSTVLTPNLYVYQAGHHACSCAGAGTRMGVASDWVKESRAKISSGQAVKEQL